MDKSADAFRTISEVAEDLAIPQHVLRFWETRFPQVKPLKRAGGRRYYRPADVELLRSIRQLLYDDGYTIKGVQRLFKERGGRREPTSGRNEVPVDEALADEVLADEVRADEELAGGNFSTPRLDRADPSWIDRADGVSARPAATVDGATLTALRDALAAVDECERILAALRHPPA